MVREYNDAINRYKADRVVPDFTLQKCLEYLLLSLDLKNYDGIATFSGVIVWNYPSFCQRHKNAGFEILSTIDTLYDSRESRPYQMMKSFVDKVLDSNGAVHKELSNVSRFIRNIQLDPFYTLKTSLTNHLASAIEFISDYDRLFRLSSLFVDAELPLLEDLWRRGNKAKRIHVVITIARIGEAIHSLSNRIKDNFFSKDFIDKLRSQRNILFHPEKDNHWEQVENAVAGTFDVQYFFDYRDELIKGYALVRMVYNTVMSREEYADEVDEVMNALEKISPQELLQKFNNAFPGLVTEEYEQNSYVYIDRIWASVTRGIRDVEILTDLSNVDNLERRMLGEVTQIMRYSQYTNCPYFSELKQYFDSRGEGHVLSRDKEFEKLKKRFVKFEYSHAFNKFLGTKQEVYETLEILEQSYASNAKRSQGDVDNTITNIELKESRQIYNKYLDFDKMTLEDLFNWRYHAKLFLFFGLRANLVELRKLEKRLERYNEHYDAAMYAMSLSLVHDLKESELYDSPTLIQEYRHFEEEYHKLLEERRELFNNILAIDMLFLDAQNWIRIRDVIPILDKIIISMDKCLKSIKSSSPDDDSCKYSAMDFYVTEIGSLIRKTMGGTTPNTPFIEKLKNYTHKLNSQEMNGYKALLTIQRWRGKIAHNHVMTAGIENRLEHLILLCSEYMRYCQPMLKEIKDSLTALLQEKPDLTKNLQQFARTNDTAKEEDDIIPSDEVKANTEVTGISAVRKMSLGSVNDRSLSQTPHQNEKNVSFAKKVIDEKLEQQSRVEESVNGGRGSSF